MKDFSKHRRNFLILSSSSMAIFLMGCDSKPDLSPKKIYFDRDVCDRCKMVISTQNYVAQIVNSKDGKHYNFDDIGCALNWIKEKNISWESDAIIYIADVTNSQMINAKEAFYLGKANSPMNFGFAAYKVKQEGENFDYEQVKERVVEIANEKKKSMSNHQH